MESFVFERTLKTIQFHNPCHEQGYTFLVLRAPELNVVLQVGLHKGRAEGTTTSLATLAIPLLMQPRVYLASYTAGACCQLILSFSSTITSKPSSSGLLSTHITQTVSVFGIALIQVQHLTLDLVESQEVCMGHFSSLGQIPLDGILSFCLHHPAQYHL